VRMGYKKCLSVEDKNATDFSYWLHTAPIQLPFPFARNGCITSITQNTCGFGCLLTVKRYIKNHVLEKREGTSK
jgi:hypothetical protein